MEKIVEESSDNDDDDIKALIEHDDEHIKQLLEDNYTEVPMDIDPTSSMETRKSHMITCPVCFEISILSKQSKLYDNLIVACMEKSSKKWRKKGCDKDD